MNSFSQRTTRAKTRALKESQKPTVCPLLSDDLTKMIRKIVICGTSSSAITRIDSIDVRNLDPKTIARVDCRVLNEIKNNEMVLSRAGRNAKEKRRVQLVELVNQLEAHLLDETVQMIKVNCEMGRNRSVLVMLLGIQRLRGCDYLESRAIAVKLDVMPINGKTVEKHLNTWAEFTEHRELRA
mmetsp:Transcript_19230/g.40093  ORF Transcript_19230/g.40093 Transcript_19230/m.40093 type:complete len:183 (+) Transcript_19230:21-569(+)